MTRRGFRSRTRRSCPRERTARSACSCRTRLTSSSIRTGSSHRRETESIHLDKVRLCSPELHLPHVRLNLNELAPRTTLEALCGRQHPKEIRVSMYLRFSLLALVLT